MSSDRGAETLTITLFKTQTDCGKQRGEELNGGTGLQGGTGISAAMLAPVEPELSCGTLIGRSHFS